MQLQISMVYFTQLVQFDVLVCLTIVFFARIRAFRLYRKCLRNCLANAIGLRYLAC